MLTKELRIFCIQMNDVFGVMVPQVLVSFKELINSIKILYNLYNNITFCK